MELKFNCIEEKNLLNTIIFKELITLKYKIEYSYNTGRIYDTYIEEYETLFVIYKNLNELTKETVKQAERIINELAKERFKDKVLLI